MLPAPRVSLWAFAGAVASADNIDGATVRASTGCGFYGSYDGGCSFGAGAEAAAAAAPTAAAGGSARARGVIATADAAGA